MRLIKQRRPWRDHFVARLRGPSTPKSIYNPLKDLGEIRMLTISSKQQSPDGIIDLLVYPTKLLLVPYYEALSYVWGDADVTAPVRCNGRTSLVTSSLLAALLQLRFETEDRVMWIDAICINQEDIREKTHQVQQMKDIYSKAGRVVMWVGPEDEHTCLTFEIFQQYAKYWHEDVRLSFETIGNSHELRSALQRFFRRSYFQRVWILQEVILSQDAIVQCGRFAISLEDIYHGLSQLGIAGSFPLLGEETQNAYRLLWWRADQQSTNGLPLKSYNLLLYARQLQTSDPRDKIFALLGIAEDNKSLGMISDYTMSVGQTYVSICKRLLKTYGPSILVCVLPRLSSIDLPSWVPDWRDAAYMKIIGSYSEKLFQAGGLNGAELHSPGGSLRLSVKGVRIDDVCEVQDPNLVLGDDVWSYCNLDQWIVDMLNKIGCKIRCGPAPSSLHEGCLRTMSADLSALSTRRKAIGKRVEFPDHYKWSRSEDVKDPPPTEVLDELARVIRISMKRRKLLISETGYLGIGPETMKPGDIVCIFLGGGTPFILRPQDADEYAFLGEAYVDGIMDGEALQDVTAEQYEQFVLR